MHVLGCLFVFIFGFILLLFSVFRLFMQSIFGKFFGRTAKRGPFGGQQGSYGNPQKPFGTSNKQQSTYTEHSNTYSHTTAGNARHEGGTAQSGQQRSGKIFQKDEGEYVDFEEV